ncbi:m34 protein [Murid betaherpesvirus 1]|nr:m34 protein [Murid betaherpesvirus 1]
METASASRGVGATDRTFGRSGHPRPSTDPRSRRPPAAEDTRADSGNGRHRHRRRKRSRSDNNNNNEDARGTFIKRPRSFSKSARDPAAAAATTPHQQQHQQQHQQHAPRPRHSSESTTYRRPDHHHHHPFDRHHPPTHHRHSSSSSSQPHHPPQHVSSAPPIHHLERRRSDPVRAQRRYSDREQQQQQQGAGGNGRKEGGGGSRHEPPAQPPTSHHRETTMPSSAPSKIVRYEAAHRYTMAEGFIRSVSGTYKMMNRAEDRKRMLSNQLPSCIKSKSIANSFIFCTSSDGDILESEIASMRRHQKHITDFSKLDRAIHGVSCRIRKHPISPNLSEQQVAMIRAIRIIAISFNRITYVARVKHYCDKDSRFSNYLRDQLTKRCSEGSRLNLGIRRFISSVNVEKNRDLCMILVGMLCQTPHMWARSIRLLCRLKIFYQNVLIKMFADEKIDLRDVFELQYHSTGYKIQSQIRQYTSSAFVLNDAVGTVVNMIRQRQSSSSGGAMLPGTVPPPLPPDPHHHHHHHPHPSHHHHPPLHSPHRFEEDSVVGDEVMVVDQGAFASFSPPKTPAIREDILDEYIFYPRPGTLSDVSSDTDSPRHHRDTDSDTGRSSVVSRSSRTPPFAEETSDQEEDGEETAKSTPTFDSDPFSPGREEEEEEEENKRASSSKSSSRGGSSTCSSASSSGGEGDSSGSSTGSRSPAGSPALSDRGNTPPLPPPSRHRPPVASPIENNDATTMGGEEGMMIVDDLDAFHHHHQPPQPYHPPYHHYSPSPHELGYYSPTESSMNGSPPKNFISVHVGRSTPPDTAAAAAAAAAAQKHSECINILI